MKIKWKDIKCSLQLLLAFAVIIGFIIIFIKGCTPVKSVAIVNGKTIENNKGLLGGSTIYRIGYNKGFSRTVSFGEYQNTNIGDTLYYNTYGK